MQRALTLLAAALLATSARDAAAVQPPAAAPTTSPGAACPGTPANAERELLRLEDEWNRAGTARDAAFFERLLADDFMATGGQRSRTRADVIASVRDTTDGAREHATLSDTRVRVYGDVAVVSGLSSYDGPPPVRRRYTEIFVCRDGRWQAVHGHYNDVRLPSADSARGAAPSAANAGAPPEDSREPGRAGSPQFMHAFRGYPLAQGGRCDEALRALAQAPQQDRPLIHAVRPTCVAKAGRRTEVIAERDETLGNRLAGVFAWPYIIARHVARQVR
jgi:ketosteroid isomerase-like protein